MRFYLGTHMPNWLSELDVDLFVSRNRLWKRKTVPVATCDWALDSGGFTELSKYGRWRTSAQTYAEDVRRFSDEIGRMQWAAPQDWMCEPFMIEKTGRSVEEHQERTVENYLDLRRLAPGLPIIPVLQGWELDDYLACVELYANAGIDLAAQELVGVGSVCRRENTTEAARILRTLASGGLRLHGFGIKQGATGRYVGILESADSMAWSYNARRKPPMPGCSHKSCANCKKAAIAWRQRTLTRMVNGEAQQSLFADESFSEQGESSNG